RAGELGRALGVPQLLLKREDLSPTGSHKGRAMGLLCASLADQGQTQAVVSSSGNAAAAAATYSGLAGVRLLALLSPRTPGCKLEAVRSQPQLTVLSSRPVGLLHHAVAAWGMTDLRTSVHPLGAVAYRGIAAELLEGDRPAGVFVFSSSGATALGLAQGFERLLPRADLPQIHLVEAGGGGELTRPWYPAQRADPGPADRLGELGTRRTRLAPGLRRLVRRSGGRGWRIGWDHALRVQALASGCGVETSWEGIATLAALEQAAAAGALVPDRPWVALLTGHASQLRLEPDPSLAAELPRAEAAPELDLILESAGFQRPGPR
ncbi:MAG: PLP-dependent lyase/thiolase, partial [Candidatus Dormibacteria bacterium]